jgi:peptidoglycan hydrolase-like protein with peptidoglycan-binding domain
MWLRTVSTGGLIAAVCLSAGPPAALAADHGQRAGATVVPLTWQAARARPVLTIGSTGAWVRRLKVAFDIHPAGRVFGSRLGTVVKAFRVHHHLSAKPVVDAATWRVLGNRVPTAPAKPAPAPTTPAPTVPATDRPTLRKGDSSSWVQAVQHALGVVPESGYFGTVTDAAVRAFQSQSDLPVTGVVDAGTWAALGARVVSPPADITTSEQARTSRAFRRSVGVTAFVGSWTAQLVLGRESGGSCTAVSPGGTYRGRWQMDSAFWAAYGGTAFTARADLATCDQQDAVAYAGWVDRWWQPWPTAIP